MTLAMWALALLTTLRAECIGVEAFNSSLSPAPLESSLAAFKASRGLTSH